MKDEMKSMKDNDIWDLVKLPDGAKPIGCKWIFKTKSNSKGNVERYKARLVVDNFTQKEYIDYKETLSPVLSKNSFRIIMLLVSHFELELHQMDVKNELELHQMDVKNAFFQLVLLYSLVSSYQSFPTLSISTPTGILLN
ncbi:cysteine-rich RLK (RECEPTOR-like protein kinase) 8 [Abeliophyllum distichum]|uniref:Cysteine-rich RLK (RECEPTOR-like protein kinase) 8 n=1 Tax=Abeliophyllum distichum TaxID=126358 RepID=A0ABD1Q810_9LAMI